MALRDRYTRSARVYYEQRRARLVELHGEDRVTEWESVVERHRSDHGFHLPPMEAVLLLSDVYRQGRFHEFAPGQEDRFLSDIADSIAEAVRRWPHLQDVAWPMHAAVVRLLGEPGPEADAPPRAPSQSEGEQRAAAVAEQICQEAQSGSAAWDELHGSQIRSLPHDPGGAYVMELPAEYLDDDGPSNPAIVITVRYRMAAGRHSAPGSSQNREEQP